jgi:uncharacterized SAM-binding protein YcdF (DUF218 family)
MRILIGFIIGILLVVTSIGVYLAPDDLRGCAATPDDTVKCEKANAIVAVSGGNTSVRAAEAISLYKNGWGKYLIFSGAAADTSGPSNAEMMKQQAVDAGVPNDVIITDNKSQTTKQNAEQTEIDLRRYEINRLIVVTSPYHQRRAGLEFKIIAGPSVAIVNHPAPNDPDWPWYWWLTPRGWWLAGSELIKIGAVHAGESR